MNSYWGSMPNQVIYFKVHIMKKILAGLSISFIFFLSFISSSTISAGTLKVAFGSCLKQNLDQSVWRTILREKPDVFFMMGDNVYVNSGDPVVIKQKYDRLGSNKNFQLARQHIPMMAIWDDHDYGENNAGKEFLGKKYTKKAFLEFFNVPNNDPRWHREGLYHAKMIEEGNRKVQVIMLDTRWFRDTPPAVSGSQSASLLGVDQWAWLEHQFKIPADLRLLISPIQLIPQDHKGEKWADFPLERRKFFDLLKRMGTNNLVILSGDVHLAEISKIGSNESGLLSPLYEVTASSLNKSRGVDPFKKRRKKNRYRVGGLYRAAHFGLMDVDWLAPSGAILKVEILDALTGGPMLARDIVVN